MNKLKNKKAFKKPQSSYQPTKVALLVATVATLTLLMLALFTVINTPS